MSSLAAFLILIVIGLPIVWFSSEFSERRGLRIALGIGAILSSFAVATLAGLLEQFKYNAWYGGATKDLIDTTINEIEDGNIDRVMAVLRRLRREYQPTYENRARYDELVAEAVADLADRESPLSDKDSSPFTSSTWDGYWEDDTGFWLVINGKSVICSGSGNLKMHNVKVSEDARKMTFDEEDRWHHVLTLNNKYEARHEWLEADTGKPWKTDTLHKLIRATPAQRRFTQQDVKP